MASVGGSSDPFYAIRPANTALLVVDVQNDYCDPAGAFARAGQNISTHREVVPRIARLVESVRSRHIRVVYVQNTVDPAAQMLSALQRRRRMRAAGTTQYVVDGTWGQQFTPPLALREGDLLIRKYASSAFVGTPLDQMLRSQGITMVLVTGVVTWGCVMATAQSAAFQGYMPVIVSDCVAGNDPYLHEAALEMMRRSFGPELVIASDQFLASMSAPIGSAPGPAQSAFQTR